MIAIRCYFVFVLSATVTALPTDEISEEALPTDEISEEALLVDTISENALPTDEISEEEFLNVIFELHNEYRAKHGVANLTLDDKLIKLANEVLLNPTEENLMSFPEGYGAIFDWKALPSKLSVKEANNFFQTMWYGKGKKYDYDNEPLNTDAEKFTQIVWMSTTNVGFAMHILHEVNAYSVLGFYLPPGNQKDQFRANVFRPQSAEEPIA